MDLVWLLLAVVGMVILLRVAAPKVRENPQAFQPSDEPKKTPDVPPIETIKGRSRKAGRPSYQTAPLSEYSSVHGRRALELFEMARQNVGTRGKKYRGSFTIMAGSCSETAAKIIIYERGLGRENGDWPGLQNGIYVLVRLNGVAGNAIWDEGLLVSNAYSGRLDPKRTLGVAPNHSELFAYFRLEPEDDLRSIAELLVMCAAA